MLARDTYDPERFIFTGMLPPHELAKLFNLTDLGPGQTRTRCVAVTYTGTIVPATIRFGARASGPLADNLSVNVEVGEGGGFRDCAAFRPAKSLFAGTLDNLVRVSGPDGQGVVAFQAPAVTTRSFRFTFHVAENGVQSNEEASADFVWEARTT